MKKEEIIKEQFLKAIEDVTSRDYFYTSESRVIFNSNNRKFEIEKDSGLFHAGYTIKVEGDVPFSQMSMKTSYSMFNEIREHIEQKLLSLNFSRNRT